MSNPEVNTVLPEDLDRAGLEAQELQKNLKTDDPIAEKLRASFGNLEDSMTEEEYADHIERMNNTYHVTYTTYSGADCTIEINGVDVGTISEIGFSVDRRNRVTGWLVETFFEETQLFPFPKKATCVLKFRNEYGKAYDITLKKLSVNYREFSAGMDDIVIEQTYYFTAKGVTEGIPSGPKTSGS